MNANMILNGILQGLNIAKGFARTIKPGTWLLLGGVLSFGLAGGVLLRQPEINRLSEAAQKAQSEVESLRRLVQAYHDKFVELKASNEVLKAKAFEDNAKYNGVDMRAVIMYQYAAQEYIELFTRPQDEQGIRILSEKEYNYYQIFKKVVGGERLDEEDAKKLQNYIYPKYKKEIEGLIEVDFEALMKQITA